MCLARGAGLIRRDMASVETEAAPMVRLGELMMILDLHRQGLSVSDIARRTGFDRKTVRRYIARGLEPPAYTPRPPRLTLLAPYHACLRERVAAFPELRASRLLRELRAMGYRGGYTQLTDFLRTVRPQAPVGFEQRFETPPGQQAQVDFAHFRAEFTAEPGVNRVVWLFSMVLGHSRLPGPIALTRWVPGLGAVRRPAGPAGGAALPRRRL